jgi:hypothetical protein
MPGRSKVRAWDYMSAVLRRSGLLYYGQGVELTEAQERLEDALRRVEARPLTIEQIEALAEALETAARITEERLQR